MGKERVEAVRFEFVDDQYLGPLWPFYRSMFDLPEGGAVALVAREVPGWMPYGLVPAFNGREGRSQGKVLQRLPLLVLAGICQHLAINRHEGDDAGSFTAGDPS